MISFWLAYTVVSWSPIFFLHLHSSPQANKLNVYYDFAQFWTKRN